MPAFSAEVTPVILTRDEEPNIGRTLAQLAWAREVVVIDSFSSDATVSIAQSFPNVRLLQRPLDDLASQWTYAVAQANTPWVLTLDADYLVGDAFASELAALDPPGEVSGYEAAFRYAVRGRLLRGSLYPPRAVLLRRERCRFFMDGHTQRVAVEGGVLPLREPLVHDDRKSFRRFLERQKRYMRDEARAIRSDPHPTFARRIRRLRVVAPFAVALHALFVKGLILDGVPGWTYAWERFVAEVMLSIELMKPARSSDRPSPAGPSSS